jgi:hypothetical protein
MFDKVRNMMYNANEVRESSITPNEWQDELIKIAPPPIIYAEKASAEMRGLLARLIIFRILLFIITEYFNANDTTDYDIRKYDEYLDQP